MLRNREIRILAWQLAVVILLGALAGGFFNFTAGIVVLLTGGIICLLFFYFTKKRYQEIALLSQYLAAICAGNYHLDVRDNEEGELSILKNDIYKVTLTLSEQSELLKRDKEYLAGALSDISHQLKTPLTSLFVMTDLLSREELPAEKRIEFTRNIREQLERMEWLLSSLLKLSKIDAGTLNFKKEQVQVKKLVEKAVAPLLIPMELKEQELIVLGTENAVITADFNWTAEALVNILKNCVEHTQAGGRLEILCRENPIYTSITVKDNGPGISSRDLPYIFDRFYKGKNAGTESVGIGLAMAKAFLSHQHASLSVESREGQGAEFHVIFYKQIT